LAWRSRSCEPLWISLATISVAAIAGLLVVVFVAGTFRGPLLTVSRIQPRDAETLAYVATYLIPFLALDLTDTEDLISFVVFMFILGIISVTSHALFVNPVLSLLGYHTYDITDSDNYVYFVLTRRNPRPGDQLRPIPAGSYVRFEGCHRVKHLRN
jgi:hypothetical protein